MQRKWEVLPHSRHGYGGASTHALLFELHQIWKEQGFRGSRIYFETLRKLYRRLHPGKNPSRLDYARLSRDLDILCGYEFRCERSFWDPVTRRYGSLRGWHIFTMWFEPRGRLDDARQEELPFGFIEVSDTFTQIARGRGFFVTGFDSPFFYSLRPVEQRLALYLSKMFASQQLHRRFEDDIFAALPIEGQSATKNRQTLRQAVAGLIEKGYPNLAAFSLERGRGGRWLATFKRRRVVEQDRPVSPPSLDRLDPETRQLVEDILEQTQDYGSIPMWIRAVRGLGESAVRLGVADLRSTQAQRSAGGDAPIRNPGAWLTTKFMKMAEERGTPITRHKPPR